ncbi:MAG: membrane oxidoreductase [Acidimicrobiaceae bacterium]|nr:SRPBCC family protein [Acidimicrobiaceae bacterium]MCY3644141.1 SRPBCC family protein [Acidimicrobiaceae bacterium]MDE0495158.1 SRPBCC family protein [Acidimicrobiaceae bacterium]MDE0664456.1 SRPBCC family protein [Acidimicrobiaceae bacterium]MXY09079.1 membrane oxidoreductase [Acidimicrobiaceae bacterium]
MELNDSFEVAHPIGAVWDVITDVERIAPCLPGAQLTGSDGDAYEGLVKVKVGPITSQYKGKASFTERDDANHRLLMSASGRDTRGAGNASAEITVALEAVSDTATRVSVNTDLTITGKVAQFGRGVLADVSKKLMGQFADNLAALVAADVDSGEPAEAEAAGEPAGSDASDDGAPDEAPAAPAPQTEVEAVDLLEVAGAPVLKRLVPVIVAVIVVVIIVIIALAA